MKSVSKLVRLMGLEPIRLLTHAPQTCLSAYSSTLAFNVPNYTTIKKKCQALFCLFRKKGRRIDKSKML